MTKTVIQCWFEIEDPKQSGGRPPFYIIETNFETFEDAQLAARDDEVFHRCQQLVTVAGPTRGERTIVGRRPYYMRGSAIKRMVLPEWKLLEEAAQ